MKSLKVRNENSCSQRREICQELLYVNDVFDIGPQRLRFAADDG